MGKREIYVMEYEVRLETFFRTLLGMIGDKPLWNAGGKCHAVAGKAKVFVGIGQPLFDFFQDFFVIRAHTDISLPARPDGQWCRGWHDPVHIPRG